MAFAGPGAIHSAATAGVVSECKPPVRPIRLIQWAPYHYRHYYGYGYYPRYGHQPFTSASFTRPFIITGPIPITRRRRFRSASALGRIWAGDWSHSEGVALSLFRHGWAIAVRRTASFRSPMPGHDDVHCRFSLSTRSLTFRSPRIHGAFTSLSLTS